jgi:hypothetical protein
VAVLDLATERKPPFSPEQVVSDFCGILRTYNVTEVNGDRYAGSFSSELFERNGIKYVASERNKNDLYK